jgi:phospholipid transport system substrate-binding protein
MKKLNQVTLILFTLILPGLLFAATSSPVDMLRSTADRMIAELKANKASLQQDPNSVYSIVKRILLPHVDQETMARSVLGRDVWQNGSESQHKRFIDEYTFLLVRTYSRALASYNDQTIDFLPIREDLEDKKFIEVNSLIRQKDGPSIPVDYRLRLLGNEWKIYDITVDNVSMIQSYRAQFAEKVAQGGFEGLINSLTELNQTRK